MKRALRIWLCAGAVALLAACGGGGGSPGVVPNQPVVVPDPAADATSRVADLSLFLDKASVTNNGSDTAQVTVVAVDAARNVVSGARIGVTADSNAIFTPGATPQLTDATGRALGSVSPGADRSDRVINVTASSNNIVRTIALQVRGSRLTLSASPTTPAPGQTVLLSLSLTDAAGNAIPNVNLSIGGTTPGVSGTTRRTGLDGRVNFSFAAPSAAGIYVLSASGNGVRTVDTQLQVFSTFVPPVTIPASIAPSLSASPNVIPVNSPGVQSSRSTLRFLMLDGQNRPVQGVRVKFLDQTVGVPAVGSTLVNAGVTLYTDASGVVVTDYIAGQNPSPTNGVNLRACYSGSDFASAADCPNAVTTSLTIAGQALAVSVGDDNLATKGPGTYIKQFVVSVADAAGKPVPNAPVDISVDLTHYGKAASFVSPFRTLPIVPALDQSTTTQIGATPSTTTGTGTAAVTIPGSPGVTFSWCRNEDINRNGFVDPGENVNNSVDTTGQPTLEPRKADLLISYVDPNKTTTDASGILLIKVEYSQRFATWLSYRVRAIANVQGSQGMAERLFVTQFIQGDEVNGSFLIPPYGSDPSCTAPN